MKHGKTTVHSHEQAFMNGSLEKGLGSMNGPMGDFWSDLVAKATNAILPSAPVQAVPVAAPVAVIAKPNMTMTYVKYGGIAVGGLVGLMLVMKALKGKSA